MQHLIRLHPVTCRSCDGLIKPTEPAVHNRYAPEGDHVQVSEEWHHVECFTTKARRADHIIHCHDCNIGYDPRFSHSSVMGGINRCMSCTSKYLGERSSK